jgi:hypothetical protein
MLHVSPLPASLFDRRHHHITLDAKIKQPSTKTPASPGHSSNNSQPSTNLPPKFSPCQIALVTANVSSRVIFPFKAAERRQKVAHGASRGFVHLSCQAPAGAAEGHRLLALKSGLELAETGNTTINQSCPTHQGKSIRFSLATCRAWSSRMRIKSRT